MSIFTRIKNIFRANANAALDKVEDPEKMIEQAIKDMGDAVSKTKGQTASVIAIGYALDRKIELKNKEVEELREFARKAIAAGNDEDATAFLNEKAIKEEELAELKNAKATVDEKSKELLEISSSANRKYSQSLLKRDLAKTKMAVIRAKELSNQSLNSVISSSDVYTSAINSAEEKMDLMLDKMNAAEQVERASTSASLAALKSKYSTCSISENIKSELNELKGTTSLA